MSHNLKRLWLFVFFCLVSGMASAATFYATPSGAGSKDGSLGNPIDETQIQSFFNNSMGAGDTLELGSGNYDLPGDSSGNRLKISSSGSSSADKVLKGVNTGGGRPVLLGQWSAYDPDNNNNSASGIWINANISHITFTGFDIYGMKNGIISSSSGNVTNITFKDMNIQHCSTCFYLRGVSSSLFLDCTLSQYNKSGIRFNDNCSLIEVENVVADCNLGNINWPSQAYPTGFGMEANNGNHDITFRGCVAKNNYYASGSGVYWNGDGFRAEDNAYNIAFYDCEAYGSTDAGWDDKSEAAYYENCISLRNKRNFRIWNTNGSKSSGGSGEYTTMVNCLGAYAYRSGGTGSADCFWTNGLVEVHNSTFHNGPGNVVHVENRDNHDTHAIFNDSILSQDNVYGTGNLTNKENGTTLTLNSTAQYKAGVTGTDPDYVNESQNWSGSPVHAFNSQLYGSSKGYYVENVVLVEAGKVTWTQDSGWKTVSLNSTFVNPIVVMSPVSANGGDPCHARVRNVTSSSFQFSVEEWDYLDGNHGADETLYYLVVEFF